MNQRFSITPANAATDNRLSDSVHRTLTVIGIFGDKNGWCWPSQKTLAELRGVSRQTINAHIKELISLGYLNIAPRYDDETGAQKSNMMQIKFDYAPDLTGGVKSRTLQGVSSQELYTPHQAQDLTHNAPVNAPHNAPNNNNSSSSSLDADYVRIVTVYEQEIGMITQLMAGKIVEALQDFTAATVEDAIKQASMSNVRKWSYVEAILKNWKEAGRGKRPSPPKAPRIVKVNINGQIVEKVI